MISASGVLGVIPAVQRIKLGSARAGQLAHVWADEFTVHVFIGGQLVKTVPSSLTAEDLATLRMRGAGPAGPPPAAPAPARAGALPGGTVIEVNRAVDSNRVAELAGHRLKVGAELARRRVTLRLDGHLIHVICDGALAKTLPSPVPASDRGTLRGARIAAAAASSRPASASSGRSRATASSWSPASGCVSERPTPGRSSPSTSRTPTSASPATAPRYPCTPAPNSDPSRDGKPRSMPRKPNACPATPEHVNHVVSRNCQASPETTHHKPTTSHAQAAAKIHAVSEAKSLYDTQNRVGAKRISDYALAVSIYETICRSDTQGAHRAAGGDHGTGGCLLSLFARA